MKWERDDVAALAGELVTTGLATPEPYNHLSLNPALCPYLRARMDQAESELLTTRWTEAMGGYVEFLDQQRNQHAEVAARLTLLELPNLFALLKRVENAGNADATIHLTTSLYALLQRLGKTRLLERVAQASDSAAKALGETWNHARFEAQRTRIDQQFASGHLRDASESAQKLLRLVRAVRETAYRGADYDLAMACWLLGGLLKTGGGAEQALPLLEEAQTRFEAIARQRDNKAAQRMASVCLAERGDCFRDLGRLDEAADSYEEGIGRAERLTDGRQVAIVKGQLGSVRLLQRRYDEALHAYEEAREHFSPLEPGTVATTWHQTGVVYEKAGQPEAAEDAYRKSLTIAVQLGDVARQASTLGQLGNLYTDVLGRAEEAVAFLRQAADKYVEIHDAASEGRQRNNLAECLRRLRRFDEAREEVLRAIKCEAQFGHESKPWTTWAILADIEADSGNLSASAQAKQKAVDCCLAYRRDGGENHDGPGRLVFAMTEQLAAGGPAAATAFLQQVAARPDASARLSTFIQALQAILNGSRDRTLANAPDLHYTMAAEILLLIEDLDQANPAKDR
jgi:tetratricopeptide (TPR) repeat protein